MRLCYAIALAALLAGAAVAQPREPSGLAAATPAGQTVRVRLFEEQRPRSVRLAAEGGALLLRDGRRTLHALPAGASATLSADGGRVAVEVGGRTEHAAQLEIAPMAGAAFRLRAGSTSRAYRGRLTVRPDPRRSRALLLVNTLELEDYVASVIPAEYPFPEIEGVKAQAVLVRTYALKSLGKYGDYDLVDHVGSQVYNGLDAETPVARRAAEATRGEVLTYGGQFVEAVYSSSSGGHTADNEAVWDSGPIPYLRGRPDPYDRAAPDHAWTTDVDRSRLHRALSEHYGFAVRGIEVAGTSPEGRVTQIRLLGARPRTVQANAFRLAVSAAFGSRLLRSTFFTLEQRGERYVFRGRGFGHGVGMSQHGAREQARQGRSYRDILAFYFTGTRLERADALPPPLLADAPEAAPEITPARPPVHPIPVRPVSTVGSQERTRRVAW